MKTSGIIHVSAYYPPHLGGQEIAVQDLVTQLSRTGVNVEVITSNRGARAGVSIEDGVLVTRLRSAEFGHTAITWSLFFWLLRHAKQDTVVHLHFGQAFVSEVVWLASRIKHFRYIMHIHCYPVQSGPMGRLLPLYKRLFLRREIQYAEAVVVLNSHHRRIIRSDYGYAGRLLVMFNGLDGSFFEAKRSAAESGPAKLLFVGRLTLGKNLDILLEAVNEINHDITLDIIGDGECRHQLETIMKDKGLKNARLHGRLSRDEIKEFYATSDALILPSSYEAQPIVLLEAMAARVPIIVTKGIGVELDTRAAILIEPTVEGITDGIENLLGMPADARELLTDVAFERAEGRRWDTLIHSYIQLYEEVENSLRSAGLGMGLRMKTIMLTTSWDDGHRDDIRLARMLKAYGLKGTFYVSPEDQEFARQDLLTAHEIRNISLDFEIGAHTLTHPRLPAIPEGQAEEEIFGSKTVLEEITGKKVETFCYPYGSYTKAHVQLVKKAGYRYARTVTRYRFELADPYEAGTSVHAYNHGCYDMWRIAHFARFRPVRALQYSEWDALACAMFDRVIREGGIYHLWGHSWEIDKHNDWDRLERVFRYISAHPQVKYVANGELGTYAKSAP